MGVREALPPLIERERTDEGTDEGTDSTGPGLMAFSENSAKLLSMPLLSMPSAAPLNDSSAGACHLLWTSVLSLATSICSKLAWSVSCFDMSGLQPELHEARCAWNMRLISVMA